MGIDAERALQAEFAERGFCSGEEFYVLSHAASTYLEQCRCAGLAVVGAEAVERRENKIRPRLDLVADFSALFEAITEWAAVVEQSHREARDFLHRKVSERELWWNFTLLDEHQR